MVSGNVSHLFGYVYETPEGKYELEIKFDDDFPYIPPDLVYHKDTKELLGDFQLETVNNWTINSSVVDIIIELKTKIQQVLLKSKKEKPLSPTSTSEVSDVDEDSEQIKAESLQERDEGEPKTPEKEKKTKTEKETEKGEYLTPDLNAYPPDSEYEQFLTPSEIEEEISPEKDPHEYSFVTEPTKVDEIESQETINCFNSEIYIVLLRKKFSGKFTSIHLSIRCEPKKPFDPVISILSISKPFFLQI